MSGMSLVGGWTLMPDGAIAGPDVLYRPAGLPNGAEPVPAPMAGLPL